MAKVQVIAQINESNSSFTKLFLILNGEVRQIGVIEYAPGTSFEDGVKANTEIAEALKKCYAKRIKEMGQ